MGPATSIAMGVALKQPNKKVFCLDGDCSAIMHLGAMAVIGQYNLPNPTPTVLNNGLHDSVGGMATVGLGIEFTKIVRACGYNHTASGGLSSEIKAELKKETSFGSSFLEIKDWGATKFGKTTNYTIAKSK